MRRLNLLLVLAGCGLALAACASESDVFRENADEIERVYGLPPVEARVAARQHPELATPEAQAAYRRMADAYGLKRLVPDDVAYFVDFVAKKEDPAAYCGPDLLTFVANLRKTFAYELRFRERDELKQALADRRKYSAAFEPGVGESFEHIRRHAPLARFPIVALDAATLFASVPPARVDRTLDRFARLEIDLGVRELQPAVLVLLATVAKEPAQCDALSLLVRNLPSLQAMRVEPASLATIADVPSAALASMLERLGPTRAWRNFVGFNNAAALYLKELSARPEAAALVGLLEEASEDFQSVGTKEEARLLVKVDAAAPAGQAREALAAAFRARAVFDRLDDRTAELLIALVSKADLRDAVIALRSAFGQWRPTAEELSALELLSGATNLGPVARSVRTLGYELKGRALTREEATAFADLSKANASDLINALHLVLPRLVVKGAAALTELAALARAGVTREDVLRLDADSIQGTLDATRRLRIVERVKKAG